jgi:hypothetical protein
MYSGNRKLGIVYGLPDMESLFTVSNIIDSGISQISISGTDSIEKTGEFNIIQTLSANVSAEVEWPKPCEYFGAQILASEFPSSFIFKAPMVNAQQLNIYNDLNNLNNTGILYSGKIYDNEYLFRYISGVDLGNGLTGRVGAVFDRNNASLADVFSTTTPTTSITGISPNQSGVFRFVRANEGFNYEVQYTRNLNSSWLFTGINLQASLSQTNVPSGFTRVEYLLPLSQIIANGNLFFRIKIQKIEYLEIGRYSIVNNTGLNLLNISVKNSINNSQTDYQIIPSGGVGILEQFDGGGCN